MERTTDLSLEKIGVRPVGIAPAAGIEKTLQERGDRYGEFGNHARISQAIKLAMVDSPNWNSLPDYAVEGLEMIAHKIGRALNGDWTYADNFHDIAGYAQLVEKELNKLIS